MRINKDLIIPCLIVVVLTFLLLLIDLPISKVYLNIFNKIIIKMEITFTNIKIGFSSNYNGIITIENMPSIVTGTYSINLPNVGSLSPIANLCSLIIKIIILFAILSLIISIIAPSNQVKSLIGYGVKRILVFTLLSVLPLILAPLLPLIFKGYMKANIIVAYPERGAYIAFVIIALCIVLVILSRKYE